MCADAGARKTLQSSDTLELMSQLVNKSLVRRAELGRFELHELLRQHAAERLAAEQAEFAEARERHARFYMGMLTAQAQALVGEHMMEARDELRVEVDNLRAAAGWAVTQWSADEARAVLSSLERFFWAHGWHEGSETFAQLVDLLESSAGGSPDVLSPSPGATLAHQGPAASPGVSPIQVRQQARVHRDAVPQVPHTKVFVGRGAVTWAKIRQKSGGNL